VSSDQQLGKRARQKAHRDAQRAQQRAAAARARRNRLIASAAVALLVFAGIGVAVQHQLQARAAAEAQRTAVAARLSSLGCTPDTAQPDRGGGDHIDSKGPANVAANPPEVLYPDRPASSGPHVSPVVKSGVYDTLIDERTLVHNLEHGYIVAYYTKSAPADQVAALKDWAARQLATGFPKIVVAPWIGGPLAGDASFAYVAWNFRQLCGRFDPDVASVFAMQHSGSNSRAPESGLAPHMSISSGGVLDPSTSNDLFPPLDQQLGDGRPNVAVPAASAVPQPAPTASPPPS
jgi:hypothetical protein